MVEIAETVLQAGREEGLGKSGVAHQRSGNKGGGPKCKLSRRQFDGNVSVYKEFCVRDSVVWD